MRHNPFKTKPVHRAKLIRDDGGVSPLCAPRPRVIDLTRATWTNRDDAVTCARCLKAIQQMGKTGDGK
jgi:hypothetical protein